MMASGGRPKSIAIHLIGYALALAAGAFALRWFEFQYTIRRLPAEWYIAAIATLFALLGMWVGNRLTRRDASSGFEKNDKALEALNISNREYDVLVLLANGHSNKEIGAALFVSPNTVKTHISSLFAKLGVSRRGQAVNKARSLRLIA